ncbi:TasA family protein [Halosegnis longus]|uniref:TasA family protein n=1 Tax=Halosegnis longus TaxID=2216012 RepID=UPI00129D3859|nr:TasA family protein [Halosegnis longus]
MTDDTLTTLSRRRLLAGLATIGGSMSAAGVGTWSLFSDDEQRNISVKAGTVSLSVDEGADPVITIDGVAPGAGDTERVTLRNTGTLDAGLALCVSDVSHPNGGASSGTDADAVADVDFNGCGTAEVEFEDESADPVRATVEYGDGETSKRTVSPGGETRLLKKSGGKNGYIASVSIGGITYENDACKHASETGDGNGQRQGNSDRAEEKGSKNNKSKNTEEEEEEEEEDQRADDDSDSDSLAEVLTVEIGLDTDDGGREVLFGPRKLAELTDGGGERCTAAAARLASGATTELFVDWEVDDDAEELAGQTVELDIEVNLQA